MRVKSTNVYEIRPSFIIPYINDCHVERKTVCITSFRSNIVFSQILLGHTHSGNKRVSKSLARSVLNREYEAAFQNTSYISRATLPRRLTDLTHSARNTRQAVSWMDAVDVKNNGNENSVGQNWVTSSRTSLQYVCEKSTFSYDTNI